MKRKILMLCLVVGLLSTHSNIYGADLLQTLWTVVISSVQVKRTAVILSDPINITNYKAFGYHFTVHGSTHQASDVKLEYQITDYHDPKLVQTTKTSVFSWSTDSSSVTWQTPLTGSVIDSSIVDSGSTNNLYQVDAFVPMVTKYIRFRVTGNGTNDSLTYITLKISRYAEK